ncbi:MAG: hypothetical protein NTZ10_03750 [Candidatus Saganbacteria bacterium]|nr:hypothetical protein [Candidatus Saganbacteria bacterium]
MSVNILNKAASQEMAAIANNALISGVAGDIKDKNFTKSKYDSARIEENLMQVLEAENFGEEGMSVLRAIVNKVAGSGIILAGNPLDQGQKIGAREKEDAPKKAGEETEKDSVEVGKVIIKKTASRIANSFNLNNGSNFADNKEAQTLVEQYSAAYCEFLTNNKKTTPEKLVKLEAALKEKGLSDKDMAGLQKEARAAIRADISVKIKETLLMRELSGSKLESAFFEQATHSILENSFFNEKTGGWDFGGYNDNLQGTVDSAGEKVKEELSKFALEHLEEKLISKMVNKDKSSDDITPILNMLKKTGTDIDKWANKVWKDRKEDLGFNLIDVPVGNVGLQVNTSTDDQSGGKKEKGEFEYTKDDEKEILVNRMRGLYMKRLLKNDLRTYLTTSFEIRKLKNGLMALSVYTRELDEKIAFEAEISAKEKVVEMIKEALLERATLYHLRGPAFKLVEKKMKGLLKNAARLGIDISEPEFESLKYNANKRMIDIVRRQIEVMNDMLTRRKNNNILKEISKLRLVEKRLIEETSSGPEPDKIPVEGSEHLVEA